MLAMALCEHFNLDEMRIMASIRLDVDWEAITGETRESKALDLVEYLQRRGRIDDLRAAIKAERGIDV